MVRTPQERHLIEQIRRGWPAPDETAIQSSVQLAERIQTAITAAGGVIGFDDYMQMALYEPGLGYYSGGAARFGKGGDFVTAPLLSPLFSRTLARQCADCLTVLEQPMVLELGAGTGEMAADLLAELAELEQLPQRYFILELSAALREQQQATLQQKVPHLASRVEWLAELPPQPIEGVLLANEVLDALPVQRFKIQAEGVAELVVGQAEGRFVWQERPAADALQQAVAGLEAELGTKLPPGYVSEYSPQLQAWLASLAEILQRGVMLFIDYGYPRAEYYHPQRHMGSLICHYRHRAHDDPLILPGLQDITAFVDFSAVAEAGVAAGLNLLGFAPQGQFLLGAGLLDLVQEMAAEPGSRESLLLAQQVKTLTLPGEMGERFKVMALGRDFDAPLRGFSLADQRFRL